MATLKTISLGQCARPSARRSASVRHGGKATAVPNSRARASTLIRCASEASPGSSSKNIARRDVLSLAAAATVVNIAPPVFAGILRIRVMWDHRVFADCECLLKLLVI
eukprot:1307213-Pyramimonas_sp.AAC.2